MKSLKRILLPILAVLVGSIFGFSTTQSYAIDQENCNMTLLAQARSKVPKGPQKFKAIPKKRRNFLPVVSLVLDLEYAQNATTSLVDLAPKTGKFQPNVV